MSKFYRYGQWWYTTKKEAEAAIRLNERMCFDWGLKAYHIIKPIKSIWDF